MRLDPFLRAASRSSKLPVQGSTYSTSGTLEENMALSSHQMAQDVVERKRPVPQQTAINIVLFPGRQVIGELDCVCDSTDQIANVSSDADNVLRVSFKGRLPSVPVCDDHCAAGRQIQGRVARMRAGHQREPDIDFARQRDVVRPFYVLED